MKQWIFAALFLTLSAYGYRSFKAGVTEVTDGDTLKIKYRGRIHKVRLYGIDCPEKKQAAGEAATAFTRRQVLGKTVKVSPQTRDPHGRVVAIIYIDGICLNEALVKAGYAWVYFKHAAEPYKTQWYELQKKAKKNKAGLWKDRFPIMPWKYRRRQRKKTKSR